MRKTLYLECNAGISGDMMVASLLDLGADREVLLEVLDSIPADGFSIEIGRVKKAGIDCCDFRVLLDHAHENHDHDMEYLHGHADIPYHGRDFRAHGPAEHENHSNQYQLSLPCRFLWKSHPPVYCPELPAALPCPRPDPAEKQPSCLR